MEGGRGGEYLWKGCEYRLGVEERRVKKCTFDHSLSTRKGPIMR